MFDQNWLKRYMLANRPQGAKDDFGSVDHGGPAPRNRAPPRRHMIAESAADDVAGADPGTISRDMIGGSDLGGTDLGAPVTSSPVAKKPELRSRDSPQDVEYLSPRVLVNPTRSSAPMTPHHSALSHATQPGHSPSSLNATPPAHSSPDRTNPTETQSQSGIIVHPTTEILQLTTHTADHSSPHQTTLVPTQSTYMSPPHSTRSTETTMLYPEATSSQQTKPGMQRLEPQAHALSPPRMISTHFLPNSPQITNQVGSPAQAYTTLGSPLPLWIPSSPMNQSGLNLFGGYPTSFPPYSAEGGLRYFVVMCKDDVEIRAAPTYADDSRTGQFLHPGQVVPCVERCMVGGAWFLRLADGRGWAFETKERLLVMTQAHDFERGLWHYTIVCEDDVETRSSPTYSDEARTGTYLGSGDCMAVDEKCRVAGVLFLKLADGRGWIFEAKDRILVASEVRSKPVEARDFERGLWHYTVVCNDDVEIRAAPTYSDEARCGLTLRPGDCVAIDERCRQVGTWFLRLADGRGWVFETKDSQTVCVQMR